MRGSFYIAERKRETGGYAESLAAFARERPVLGTDPVGAATDGALTLTLLVICQ